jgi:nucleoside phosphorylase
MNRNGVILFIGAFDPEIDLLRDSLDRTTVIADGREFGTELLVCGVGSLTAALTLRERLADASLPPVVEIIQIGSAGIYTLSEASAYEKMAGSEGITGFSDLFYKMDISVIEGFAKIPQIQSHRILTEAGPLILNLAQSMGARKGATNSPDSITLKCPTLEWGLPEGCVYENLEGFGLATAAQRSGVSFGALYAITNRVGPDGSDRWRERYRAMSTDLQKKILKRLGL